MQIYRSIEQVKCWRARSSVKDSSVAMVYTKGSIHQGHIALSMLNIKCTILSSIQ